MDFVSGLLHVRHNFTDRREKIPKGKRVRSVPMMEQVLDALGRLKEREHFTGDDDPVFCSSLGGHMDAWALRRRFYRAVDAAGLRRYKVIDGKRRRITFHDLRHAFGTAAISQLDGYKVQSYGPPALLDHAALPPPQAAAGGRAGARAGVRRGRRAAVGGAGGDFGTKRAAKRGRSGRTERT